MATEETIIVFVDENGQHEIVLNGNLMNHQLGNVEGNEIVLQLDSPNLDPNFLPVYKMPIHSELDPNGLENETLKVLMGHQLNVEPVIEDPPELKARRISTLDGLKRYLPYSPDPSSKIYHSPEQYVCKTPKEQEQPIMKEEPEIILAPMSPVPPVSQTKKRISTLDFDKDFLLKKEKKVKDNSMEVFFEGHGSSYSQTKIDDDLSLMEESFEDENNDSIANPETIEESLLADTTSNDLSNEQICVPPIDPNFPHRCEICFKAFKLEISLEVHKLSHSEPYLSTLHNQSPSPSPKMPKHFKCPTCDFTCPLKATIKKHTSETHGYEFIFVCFKCKFTGLSSKEYSDHLQSEDHKKIELLFKREKKRKSRPFICDQCDYRTTNKYLLKRHMLTHQSGTDHQCPYILCSYKGNSEMYLRKHMKTHEETQAYKCTLCSYETNSPYALTRHVKLMHAQRQDRYACRQCPLKFPEMCKLRVHSMLAHGSTHTLFCRYCSFSCMDKKEYKNHLQVHYGQNLYMCSTCDFTCRSNAILKRHILRHTSVKSHKCPICSRKFHERSDLKRHIFNHSNEKPFKCDLCDYACKFRNTLTLHMKVHSDVKAYSCDICDYSTKYAQNLKKHLVVHEENKPFACNLCSYSTGLKASLKKHVERVHESDDLS